LKGKVGYSGWNVKSLWGKREDLFRKFERKDWVWRMECGESVREKRKPSVEVACGRWWEVVCNERWERWTTMTKRGISVFVGLGKNAEA